MPQTILSVVLDVDPRSARHLSNLIEAVLWLRWLERRDSSHDEPPVDDELLREMARREDWIAQNHMGSVVLVKPGVLRTILFRAGHLGLGLVLRAIATDRDVALDIRVGITDEALRDLYRGALATVQMAAV